MTLVASTLVEVYMPKIYARPTRNDNPSALTMLRLVRKRQRCADDGIIEGCPGVLQLLVPLSENLGGRHFIALLGQ